MAINTLGIAKTLAFTQLDGGPAGPLTSIQSWSFSGLKKDLQQFLSGTARVHTYYEGTESASISVETSDIATFSSFEEGQTYDNVILTIEAAVDSGGTAVGSDVTITLSEAVITEVGELAAGNDSKAPVVGSVTFTLQRHSDSSSDPTVAIA